MVSQSFLSKKLESPKHKVQQSQKDHKVWPSLKNHSGFTRHPQATLNHIPTHEKQSPFLRYFSFKYSPLSHGIFHNSYFSCFNPLTTTQPLYIAFSLVPSFHLFPSPTSQPCSFLFHVSSICFIPHTTTFWPLPQLSIFPI